MNRRIILTIAIFSVCLLSFCSLAYQPVNAQSTVVAIINPDGSVTGTSSIQLNGDVYTLIANISGGLQIQKTGVTVDGAGFTLIGNGTGRGIDLSVNSGELPVYRSVENVTIKNLIITDFTYGVYIANSGSNTFYANTVANCEAGFWISGNSNTGILYNTIQDNIDGISFNFAAGNNMVSHNNMINSGIIVWQSTQPGVDKNYWNDYITKYPDATEIGNSGVGGTPYVYDDINNFADSHPLMQPISTDIVIPTAIPSPTATVTATPTAAPTATLAVGQRPGSGAPLDQVIYGYIMAGAALVVVGFALIIVLVIIKRIRNKPSAKQ